MDELWIDLPGLDAGARLSGRAAGDLGPSGHDPGALARRRAAGAPEKVLCCRQVHSLRLVLAPAGAPPEVWEGRFGADGDLIVLPARPLPTGPAAGDAALLAAAGALEADGAITGRPGLACGVTVADCLPILLEHPEGWVGALHSGWGGTGILAVALAALGSRGLDLSRLKVVFGPCIAAASYPVPPERAALFARRFGPQAVVRCPDGQPGLDLVAANQAILTRAGLAPGVERTEDTCRSARLHSYRRDGSANYGRMMAVTGPAGAMACARGPA
jgi:copper oxidase (laccase) domain-containing protein